MTKYFKRLGVSLYAIYKYWRQKVVDACERDPLGTGNVVLGVLIVIIGVVLWLIG